MVGALFWCNGARFVCTTAGATTPPISFSARVKLFKHIHESLKYSRFNASPLTGKYQLVLNKKTSLSAVYMTGIYIIFYALWHRRTVLEVAPQWVLAMR